jgi:hypothetical protein
MSQQGKWYPSYVSSLHRDIRLTFTVINDQQMTWQLVDCKSKWVISSQGLQPTSKTREAAIKQMKSDTEKMTTQQKFPLTNPSTTTFGWNLAVHNKL